MYYSTWKSGTVTKDNQHYLWYIDVAVSVLLISYLDSYAHAKSILCSIIDFNNSQPPNRRFEKMTRNEPNQKKLDTYLILSDYRVTLSILIVLLYLEIWNSY